MKKYLLVLLIFTLASCSSNQTEKKEVEGSASDLYSQGKKLLHAKQYSKAINIFEELDRQHPYSDYSRLGLIDIVYAQFANQDYDEAILSADRFIKANIGHENLDYIYYIKGLSYYHRISDIRREQSHTIKALEVFEELENKFPNSKYAKDVKLKILLCYDHLAGKEMEVGRFYQKQGNMLAAVNRFQTVINRYQRSSHTPEALYRVAEAYMALGVEEEAVRSLSILGYNYSGDSIWYKKGYDLVMNIDDHERKYHEQKWYKQFLETK